eukprot:Lankesteria_metandrocarpae@DN7504_c0_g1_i1.p1
MTSAVAPADTHSLKREDGSNHDDVFGHIEWNDLDVLPTELQLYPTLMGGQSFSWKVLPNRINSSEGIEVECHTSSERSFSDGESVPLPAAPPNTAASGNFTDFIGVIESRVYQLHQSPTTVFFRCLAERCRDRICSPCHCGGGGDVAAQRRQLHMYFRLDTSLKDLIARWCLEDDCMTAACNRVHGLRMLQQHPTETLFAFICSANNNVPRITLLVDRLRRLAGHQLLTVHSNCLPSENSTASCTGTTGTTSSTICNTVGLCVEVYNSPQYIPLLTGALLKDAAQTNSRRQYEIEHPDSTSRSASGVHPTIGRMTTTTATTAATTAAAGTTTTTTPPPPPPPTTTTTTTATGATTAAAGTTTTTTPPPPPPPTTTTTTTATGATTAAAG